MALIKFLFSVVYVNFYRLSNKCTFNLVETTENYLLKTADNKLKIKRVIEISDSGNLPLIPDATPENLKKIPWLFPEFISSAHGLKLVIQLIVIESNGKIIIVDTCVGNHKNIYYKPWANKENKFLEKLVALGIKRENVDFVICTHIHLDHVGWNTFKNNDEWETTFPNAEYIFSEKELDHARKFENTLHGDILKESIDPVLRAGQAKLISPPYSIDKNIKIINTPGHTPGHMSVVINYGGFNAYVTGDMIHHPCQIAYPEWGTYYDVDKELAMKTRKRFLEKNAEQDSIIIGTHFSGSSIGKIIKDGDKYAFDILCENHEQKD